MAAGRKRVGVLLSGRGSNMMALVEAAKVETCPYEIAIVMSDKPEAAGLDWARKVGLTVVDMPPPTPKDKSSFFRALSYQLTNAGVDCVALAGFMRIVPPAFVDDWRGKIINIHPSLLPKYKGLDTHARAIQAGDAVAGCSVHVVTEELDGGEVLGQAEVPILPGDTPDTLAARVLAAEHRLYPRVLAEFCAR
ncbi:phosphoribosylglycinamide formyltransferase [Sphingomonas sp. HMWF008]|nr:phosphoribosylglycinamide formyltransferase [Sphingomonas sp. HMWF008]